MPIIVGSQLWGALDVQEEARGAFEEADARLLEAVADQLGSALRSATDYEQLEGAYLATAEALGSALESKDAHAAEHARSIVRNAEAVGRRLGMSGDDLRDLRYAAAFHDIGKIAVPERILNKPGPLTESEKREVERHAEVGAEILAEVDFLAGVLPLVRHCHEHWDGGGYPDGLAGDRIPLGARVILVCDAHDAMTADRPYRRALAPEAARDEIRSAAGRQFDSRVASAFLDGVGGPSRAGGIGASVPSPAPVDLTLSPQEEAFRDELRAWLAENHPGAGARRRHRRVRVPPRLAAQARRGQLRRAVVARGVRRPRRHADRAGDLQRGAGARPRPDDRQRARPRDGRPGGDRARHRGAEGALPEADPHGRGDLVPGLLGARLGLGPGLA